MSTKTITVYVFDNPTGAKKMNKIIEEMRAGSAINLIDSAILLWPMGRRRPVTQQLNGMNNPSALSSAFWGMLFGMIFFIPSFGMAVAAAMGSLSGKFSDYGVNRSFLQRIGESVTEGTSALFLIACTEEMEKLTTEVRPKGSQLEVISTVLSVEQELKLDEDFGT